MSRPFGPAFLPESGYARLQERRPPLPPSLIYPLAAAGQLRVGVRDAPVVPSLAPAGRVVGVAVAAALGDDLVGLAVADPLEDLVVVTGAVAGYAFALDQLVCGERRGPHQGHQYHHQGKHHRQLAHATLLS